LNVLADFGVALLYLQGIPTSVVASCGFETATEWRFANCATMIDAESPEHSARSTAKINIEKINIEKVANSAASELVYSFLTVQCVSAT
jgi:hypothetical protein